MFQSQRVINAISSHRHIHSQLFQSRNKRKLVLRCRSSHHLKSLSNSSEILWVHHFPSLIALSISDLSHSANSLSEFAAQHADFIVLFVIVSQDVSFSSYSLSSFHIITRDHSDIDATVEELVDDLGDAFSEVILQSEGDKEGEVLFEDCPVALFVEVVVVGSEAFPFIEGDVFVGESEGS